MKNYVKEDHRSYRVRILGIFREESLLFRYNDLILTLFDYGDIILGDKYNDIIISELQILQSK